jgi:ABC-type polysaccharide/polyol phosphate transport system ATPase subunit
MRSTSMSETPILTVKKLNLTFSIDTLRSWTWRDAFTKMGKGVFGREAEFIEIAKDMDLVVKTGERVGVLGVNGAGKTSLCRCIAGMYRPNSGTVEIKGALRALFNAGVGIQPELTGRENAELLTHFFYPEVSHAESLEIIADSLAFSELGKFLDTPFRLYSNGMQTRLCLSLASARPTDLLILDEVFDGADTFFREKIEARVLKTMQQSGAVIFVSHSFEQIRKVCTRVVVLAGGKILFDGDPETAIAHYQLSQNTKVADLAL